MSLKILLADDSVTAQNMGKKILSDAGFEVVAVSNGSAALKKIPDVNPDLVILDIYMPGYTGLEVCQKIKEARPTSSLPVLLTVGKLEPFKARDASRVRADGFIIKPFEATELLSTIKRIVGVLPEQARGKTKNGEDSKSRVREAKLAAQAAEAEQVASTLREVLPAESGQGQVEEEQSSDVPEGPSAAEADAGDAAAPAGKSEIHPPEPPPFEVTQTASGEEDQEYTTESERGSSKFSVDLGKPARQPEKADESTRFTASSFETWEKSRRPRHDDDSRENALARIRAARENEATEQQVSAEIAPQESVSATPFSTAPEIQAPEPTKFVPAPTFHSEPEPVPQESEQPPALSAPPQPPQPEAQRAPFELSASVPPAPLPRAQEPEEPSTSHSPISGLADWAADLREDATGAISPTSAPVASRWIAEEVGLDAGESAVSLSEEMQTCQAGAQPALQVQPEASQPEPSPTPAMPELEELQSAYPEPYSAAETVEPPSAESGVTPVPEAESIESVAVLAKAAAAAALSSISEIREAVLASAAAAGVAGSAHDAVVIPSQAPQAISEPTAPLSAQTAPSSPPPAEPAEDVQGATIAAVTREVHETEPADLNSDAIASIVNRVIEQMKPKLVAEIAKELAHKPRNE